MEILEPSEFFARVGKPETWRPMNCGGVVGPETTREELLARGIKPKAVDELLAYRDKLSEPQEEE